MSERVEQSASAPGSTRYDSGIARHQPVQLLDPRRPTPEYDPAPPARIGRPRCAHLSEASVRGRSFCYTALFATFIGAPPATRAQGAAPSLGKDEIATRAKVQVAIDIAHDSMDLQLAMVGNKKPEVQEALKQKLRAQIAEILSHNGMTEAQYKRGTFIVSTDTSLRRTYDGLIVQLTGAPLPGGYTPPPAGGGGR